MASQDVTGRFQPRAVTITSDDRQSRQFHGRLLTPAVIERGQTYPLVLYLHGASERGDDNRGTAQVPARVDGRGRQPPSLSHLSLAPQCPADRLRVETVRAFDPGAPREKPRPHMQVVIDMLDQVISEFPVDPTRLYLTGLSMGGYGSWDLGTRLAERWAAVAPICGGGDELYADRLAGVPVWAWHGDADDVVPVAKSRTHDRGHPPGRRRAALHASWTAWGTTVGRRPTPIRMACCRGCSRSGKRLADAVRGCGSIADDDARR